MKLKKTFLLYCRNISITKQVRTILYKNIPNTSLSLSISTSSNQDSTYQAILHKKIDVFIVECDKLKKEDTSFLQNLYFHLQNFSAPLILITSQNEKLNQLSFPYHHFYKPINEKKILHLVLKLISTKGIIPTQRSVRYKTRQDAYVKSLFNDKKPSKVKIYNLSTTGAYFEFKTQPSWKKGEFLNIKILLDDLSIQHDLTGKIMWTSDNGHVFKGFGIGVKFIPPEAVYGNLIEEVGKIKKSVSDL